MTPRDFVVALAGIRDAWTAELPRILADELYYVDVGTIGQEVVATLVAGGTEAWIARFFELVERAFVDGDSHTQELIVVGLFEAMQNANFEQGEADVVERRLGTASAAAWADLIEGWTGPGVRTVAAWRAKR